MKGMDWEEVGFRVGAFSSILLLELFFGSLPLAMQRCFTNTELRDRLLSLANVFAGGLFLASGFVHLLPEAEEIFAHELGEDFQISLAALLCPLGFGIAFFVEQVFFLEDQPQTDPVLLAVQETQPIVSSIPTLGVDGGITVPEYSSDNSHGHDHHHHDLLNGRRGLIAAYILIVVLSLHSIVAGVALGIQKNLSVALTIYIALLAHKWMEAFALGVSLLRADMKGFSFLKFVLLFSIMCPLGVLLGSLLYLAVSDSGIEDLISAVLTAIASGTFLYVAIVDILVVEFRTSRDKYLKFLLALIGFLAMASLLFAFDHEHGEDDHDHDHDHY